MEKATFGAGCFWGVQHIFKSIEGVVNTRVGYLGGQTDNPTYQDICTGNTGHAEVVEVEFDPTKLSFDELLDIFWRLHDPTQLNQQGVDIGTQYRSAIFYHTDDQKQIAEKSKANFDKGNSFGKPSVTEISPVSNFFPGEEYHQDYYTKKYQGADGPICHVLRSEY